MAVKKDDKKALTNNSAAKKTSDGKTSDKPAKAKKPVAKKSGVTGGIIAKAKKVAGEVLVGAASGAAVGALEGAIEAVGEATGIGQDAESSNKTASSGKAKENKSSDRVKPSTTSQNSEKSVAKKQKK